MVKVVSTRLLGNHRLENDCYGWPYFEGKESQDQISQEIIEQELEEDAEEIKRRRKREKMRRYRANVKNRSK